MNTGQTLHYWAGVAYRYLIILLLISLVVSELCPGQSSTYKSEQRANTLKLGKEQLRFFWNVLLNVIYKSTHFLVDIFFEVPKVCRGQFKVLKYKSKINNLPLISYILTITPLSAKVPVFNYRFLQWFLYLSHYFAISFAMLICLVYLTHCKIGDRYKSIKIQTLHLCLILCKYNIVH